MFYYTEVPLIKPFSVSEVSSVGSLVQFSCIVISGDEPLSLRWIKSPPLFSTRHFNSFPLEPPSVYEKNDYFGEDNDPSDTYRQMPSSSYSHKNEVNYRHPDHLKIMKINRSKGRASEDVKISTSNFQINDVNSHSSVLVSDIDAGIIIHQLSSKLSLLMIPNVRPEHSGFYSCQAANAVGDDHFTTHLLVQGCYDIVPCMMDTFNLLSI